MKKRNLLVTLADKNYIDQAKQLFSSAYWNGGWKGDYMLLSHEIPEKELKWFRDKGIVVKKIRPIYLKKTSDFVKTNLDKFYLFTQFFKKWMKIIYLDSDIIIRKPFISLQDAINFRAIRDCNNYYIVNELNKYNNESNYVSEYNKLISNYDISQIPFNAGVFCFNTRIIKNNTFDNLIRLSREYKTINQLGDQFVLNLYFNDYEHGNILDNLWIIYFPKKKLIIDAFNNCSVIHFIGKHKPWYKRSKYYDEWMYNRKKAELIKTFKSFEFINKNPEDINKIDNINKIKYINNKINEYIYYRSKLDYLYLINKRNFRKLLRKLIKKDGIYMWKERILYYLYSFYPKNIKKIIKKVTYNNEK